MALTEDVNVTIRARMKRDPPGGVQARSTGRERMLGVLSATGRAGMNTLAHACLARSRTG